MSIVAEDVFGHYLHDIRRHRLLTKDDEVSLAQAAEAGRLAAAELAELADAELAGAEPAAVGLAGAEPAIGLARAGASSAGRRAQLAATVRAGERAQRRFVEANLRLVVAIARRYRSSGVALEDLVQEGNLGLMRAVERYDWRRGFRFSTYASWWIRQAISHGVRASAHPIYRPAHVYERTGVVREAQQRLEASLGRRASSSELAAATDLPEAQVVEALRLSVPPRSLSEPSSREDGDTVLGDVIADGPGDGPFERLAATLLPVELAQLMSPLDEREALVLSLRFGLQGRQPLTLAAVSSRLGLTSQRISQITEAAMAKLRHPSWRQAWEAVGPLS